ncbi:DUF4422 domain-containing protein [Butyrivibrio sp. FCS014]|uniref:DUF4422 domain-containing protein n=1 Tax=Butyrivibrio sp. FCS014 TaxID=1408304 RepID=UPI0004633CE9|nr:DUF4422 domain-containing protein [Butyrivibrio sp. FCS014]
MITVIIPMYNTENYIERCLSSVTAQSYTDLEIIVIDDGSTDGSAEKVRALAQKDRRIRLIEQENHGLVYSRKVGISKALGEYVLFVDSDDYLEPDAVEKMAALAADNQADVVACGAIFEADGSPANRKVAKNYVEAKLYADDQGKELAAKLFCAEDFCTMALLPFLWNKLWKTELIKEYVLRADDRFTVGEDVAIGFPAIMAANRILVSEYAGYHYCQRQSSMMRGAAGENKEYVNACRIYRYLAGLSNEMNRSDKAKDGLHRFLVNQLMTRCYEKTNRDLKTTGLAGFTETMPQKLVIYGAGELGKAVYSYASLRANVEAWIDRDAEYLRALGYDVALPDETDIPEDCPIIVAVFDARAVRSITAYLTSRGVAKERIICFDPEMLKSEPVKNVIIWGTGTRTAMYYGWLKANYNIVAFVDEAGSEGSFDRIPVIGRQRLGEFEFDRIIVTNENPEIERACQEIGEMDVALLPKVIDINQAALGDERVENYFDYVAKAQLEKCIPSSSADYKGESYDFVFIDADHSYDGVMADYNNVGRNARVITAFHDVYAHEYDGENGGTVRAWNEVLAGTEDCGHKFFSKYPDKWMGIGVVDWNRDYYVFGAHSRGQTMRAYMKGLFPERRFLGYLYDNDEENPGEVDGEPVIRLDGGADRLDGATGPADGFGAAGNAVMADGLDTGASVYVATRGVYYDAIKERLLGLGFKDIIPVDASLDIELRNRFVPEYFRSHGWEFRRVCDASGSSGDGSYWHEMNHAEPSLVDPEMNHREPSPVDRVFVIKSAVDKPLSEDVPLRDYECYIQAGSALTESRIDNCDYFDDKGEGISERNRQMCELTAMYWIWKNYTGEIVGAEHYRRRFMLPDGWIGAFESGEADVILPVPLYVHPTLKDNYCQRHTVETWEAMEQALSDIHPECAEDAMHFFETTSCYSPCNMLISRKEVYDELCEWLFPVLFAVLEKCGTLEDSYQNRYPGFLAERLITYFFRMKADEYKVIYADKCFLN